jgi:hypothetical protein
MLIIDFVGSEHVVMGAGILAGGDDCPERLGADAPPVRRRLFNVLEGKMSFV